MWQSNNNNNNNNNNNYYYYYYYYNNNNNNNNNNNIQNSINAMPVSSCGLRLDNEAIRVAIGLRLGVNLCAPHACPCGAAVDALGIHGLSCRRSAGRFTRHSMLNDLLTRACIRSGVPAVKEPNGLFPSDEKRPDGVSLVPWRMGRCIAWDVTWPDTLAASHRLTTSVTISAGLTTRLTRLQPRAPDFLGAPKRPHPRKGLNEFRLMYEIREIIKIVLVQFYQIYLISLFKYIDILVTNS